MPLVPGPVDPDEAVIAAQHWLELVLAGELEDALPLTHPRLHGDLEEYHEILNEVLHELVEAEGSPSPWAWTCRSRPYAPQQEEVIMCNTSDVLKQAHALGDFNVPILPRTVGLIMEHSDDGWLFCGPAGVTR
jgi:hypothetical protein